MPKSEYTITIEQDQLHIRREDGSLVYRLELDDHDFARQLVANLNGLRRQR